MLLTIETVDRGCSLALERGGEIVEQIHTRSEVPQSRRLLPLVNEVFDRSGEELAQLDSIGVCRGPGAFTAIRVGVTAAKVLAAICEARLVGISSLRLLATYGMGFSGGLWSVMGARRGEVYAQKFLPEGDELSSVTEPELLTPVELEERCQGESNLLLLVRERGWKPDFSGWPDNVTVYPQKLTGALAVPLVHQARRRLAAGCSVDPDRLSPLYVRESDAARQGG